MVADRVTLIVDFTGQGHAAHKFTVSISGGVRDAIISRQTAANLDWDGDWRHAVAEDAAGWSTELRIPWTVAALDDATDGKYTVGMFFSRVVGTASMRNDII